MILSDGRLSPGVSPRADRAAFGKLVRRVEYYFIAFGQPFEDLCLVRIPLTDLYRLAACPSAFDGKNIPVFTIAKERACRDLQYVIRFPDHDSQIDAVIVAQ